MDKKRISKVEKSIPLPATPSQRNRLDDQMRSIFAHVGTIANADGSGYIEAENIKIVCSVYKRQQKEITGSLSCDFKFAPFSTTERRPYHKNEQEKDFSYQLEQALYPSIRWEYYDNTRIEIYCMVLESDGMYASLAHGITCAALALCHAKVDMYDVVCGASGGHTNKTVIDLAQKEESSVDSTVVIAAMPNLNQITLVMQTGKSLLDQSTKVS
jgi:exosome complex component MTR3